MFNLSRYFSTLSLILIGPVSYTHLDVYKRQGATSPKWQGQCPGCAEWNTLVESVAEKASGHRFESLALGARPVYLSQI